MARTHATRLAAGVTASAFAGMAFLAFAPAALAQATVSYDCTPSSIQDPFTTDVSYHLEAPTEAAAGETVDFAVRGEATFVPTAPLQLGAGAVSRTIPVNVYLDGELVDTINTQATNSQSIPSGGQVATDPPTGSYTSTEPGTLAFEIGDFTTTVRALGGLITVTTPCATEDPQVVHTTTVSSPEGN